MSESKTEPTPDVHFGTEQDYLLWRLNKRIQHGEDPGIADYNGVRRGGFWTSGEWEPAK